MPDHHYTGYNPGNLNKAKALRREMTKQEKHLWYDFLKTYPVHFYRQRPIDRYIVDFYCSEAGIVIELDGDQHGEEAAVQYDTIRSETLQKHGLEILRYANRDVTASFEGVCMSIHRAVKERLTQRGNEDELAVLTELERKWGVGISCSTSPPLCGPRLAAARSGAALTCPRHVVHCRATASQPLSGEAESRPAAAEALSKP